MSKFGLASSVHRTISEDFSQGKLAREAVALRNLGSGGSNRHSLQDYQMQLMLLEQQNRKRLMHEIEERHARDRDAHKDNIPEQSQDSLIQHPITKTGTVWTGYMQTETEKSRKRPQSGDQSHIALNDHFKKRKSDTKSNQLFTDPSKNTELNSRNMVGFFIKYRSPT